MVNPSVQALSEDPIDLLIADYLARESRGQAPSPEDFLREHPECAADLQSFLREHALFARAVAPLRKIAADSSVSVGEAPTLALGGGGVDTDLDLERQPNFGDYQLLQEIASGGMGVVYKARQMSLNRIVAFKMILAGRLASEEERARFRAEAQAVARLDHPNIVAVYEADQQAGRPYFSMRYVSGGSLREHLERLRNDPRGAARLIATVARAVHYAHLRGVLHRDLKPGNILLDEQGEPHVTDFGLALHLGQAKPNETASNMIAGTPSYMAPEQAEGKPGLTTGVDVYGLGAILYELLTGRPPFKADSALETLVQVASRPLTPPSKVVPQIDVDLEAICVRCLAKQPEERYASAADLADDLDRWLAGEPVMARPGTATEQATKWARRQPVLAGALGAAMLLALGLLVAGGLSWHNAELRAEAVASLDEAQSKLTKANAEVSTAEAAAKKQQELADEQRKLADQQKKVADEQKKLADETRGEVEKLGKLADEERAAAAAARKEVASALAQVAVAERTAARTLYAADMQLAHSAVKADDVSGANEILLAHRPPPGQADLRGFEWNYLWRQLHGEQLSLRAAPAGSSSPTIMGMDVSPDGKTLVTASMDGLIQLWDLAAGKPGRKIQAATKTPVRPGLGPDPIKAAQGAIQQNGQSFVVSIQFAPDGKSVVATMRRSPSDDYILKRVVPRFSRGEAPNLAHVGELLEFERYSITDDAPLAIEPFDPQQLKFAAKPFLVGSVFANLGNKMLTVSVLARSPDGKRMAVGGVTVESRPDKLQAGARPLMGGAILLFDVESRNLTASFLSSGIVTSLAFSPDNRLLVAESNSELFQLVQSSFPTANNRLLVAESTSELRIHDLNAIERDPRVLPNPSATGGDMAFTQNGQRLAVSTGTGGIRIWDLAEGKIVHELRGHSHGVTQLRFVDNDATLVSADRDGVVKLWNLQRLPEPVVIREHPGGARVLQFSADGASLFAADASGKFGTYDVATGGKLSGDNIKAPSALANARSPDGQWLAAAASNAVIVCNLPTGVVQTLPLPDDFPMFPAFSADGTYLATSTVNGKVLLWKVDGWKAEPPLVEKGAVALLIQFSPRHNVLAAIAGSNVLLHDVAGRSHEEAWPDDPFPGGVTTFTYSPDGALLAAAGGGEIRVRDVAAGRDLIRIRVTTPQIKHLTFLPDKRRLAGIVQPSFAQSQLKLWDLERGREVLSLPLAPGICLAAAVSPDGTRIATTSTGVADPLAAVLGSQSAAVIQIWDATPPTTLTAPTPGE